MPLEILELGKQFRPSTSHVYPPFKNGRYMEEFFYEYAINHKNDISTSLVYIPVFWTNLQNHPGFINQRRNYELLLKSAIMRYSPDTQFFTVVQHDDGPQLKLPDNTIIFGACTGTIPLPLIYEDKTNRLLSTSRIIDKQYLASFVGTFTHTIRKQMRDVLSARSDIFLGIQETWTPHVSQNLAELFINSTLNSKFCLAPRGYGRSSFRFFEAMLLDCIPVYFWDDIEWLPYKDVLDYSKFSISIQEKDISKTYDILNSVTDEKYKSMLEELKRVRHYFTLEGMSEYIKSCIQNL